MFKKTYIHFMSMQWCIVTGRSTKLEKLVCHNDLDLKLTFTF